MTTPFFGKAPRTPCRMQQFSPRLADAHKQKPAGTFSESKTKKYGKSMHMKYPQAQAGLAGSQWVKCLFLGGRFVIILSVNNNMRFSCVSRDASMIPEWEGRNVALALN